MSLMEYQERLLTRLLKDIRELSLDLQATDSEANKRRVRRSKVESAQMRAEVVAAFDRGVRAEEIARQHGLSLPYVYLIRKGDAPSMARPRRCKINRITSVEAEK